MGQKKMLVADVEAVIELLSNREWAEHFPESELGKKLESVITDLHNEISARDEEIEKLKSNNQKIVDLPESHTIRLQGNMMYTESVIKALDRAGIKYKF